MSMVLTDEQIDFIVKNYTHMAGSEMAAILNVPAGMVIRCLRKRYLRIPPEVSYRFRSTKMIGKSSSTPEIDEKITRLYLSMPVKRLAAVIGKSDTFLRIRMRQLGLIIPAEIIRQHKIDSRIKAGNVPVNKGVKMESSLKERIKHTFFQKGHLPKNSKYDGYISIRIDHKNRPYAHIRTSLGKFELLHRHLWRKVNGDIPPGFILIFKNGDCSDIRIENMELVTRKEHLFRNRWSKYPEDIRETARILTNLKKIINDYEKQRFDCTEKSHV